MPKSALLSSSFSLIALVRKWSTVWKTDHHGRSKQQDRQVPLPQAIPVSLMEVVLAEFYSSAQRANRIGDQDGLEKKRNTPLFLTQPKQAGDVSRREMAKTMKENLRKENVESDFSQEHAKAKAGNLMGLARQGTWWGMWGGWGGGKCRSAVFTSTS